MRFVLLALAVSAVTTSPLLSPQIALAQNPIPLGTASCFDYYKFGSVQANLTAPVAGTVSGANITFSGTLENANPYPVVDGALYVKIFKSRGATNDGNGPDVVDQFFVKKSIAIPASGSVPVSFVWSVPSYAQSGDYHLATFFTTSHKFNLLGLSFTDDVVGNTVPFKVLGEQADGVRFDKPSVTINNQPYYFAAFPPRASAQEPVTLQATIENTANTSENAHVTWKVYQWDAQRSEHLVQEEQVNVAVPANRSAPVSLTISDTNYPVYLVVGTLSWKDTKSIIGARFVRTDINRPRINFPSITSFPLTKDTENTLFSCLHNTSAANVPNGRLVLTLLDKKGRIIHEYRYDGTITSAMMGVAEKFTPENTYDYFTLTAKLYSGETLMDEAHITYDCQAIDPSQCLPKSYTWLYILAGILVLLGAYWFFKMRRQPEPLPPAPQY